MLKLDQIKMGFASCLIIYIFCQSIISIVSTELVCLHEGTNTTEYFSTKTPYKIRENKNSTPYDIVPDECVPLQIWMMFRHGTRYPSTKDIVTMNNRLPQLKDQIIGNQNNGTLCGSEIEKLGERRVHFEPNDDQRLAVQGEIEMIELAKRFMDRFPTILDQRYSNESYKMRFTDRQRTQASARSFALGLFGPEVGSRVRTCSFETAMMQISGEESPWCAVFSENDLQVIEYAEDLRYYWRDGYGFNISRQQACPAVQDLLRHFQRCGHEGDYRVLMLHQERVVTLPGCPENQMCPLSVFRDKFSRCDFN
ncbi:hypothetical protein B566_EDAN010842, partial [Ephemera danica]